MIDDPIVEEVRKARDEYAKRFDYDLDAICKDLQEKQQQSDRQLVSFPPKRPETGKRAYQCINCGTTVTLDDESDTLPPCPKCSGTEFRQIG